jgi:phospholipase C
MARRTPPRAPRSGRHFDPRRREFLIGMAAATGALTLPACGGSGGEGGLPGGNPGTGLSRLPPPEESGIDHIVQVMMENRSFDHFLGWVPGADGVQAGARYPNVNGEMIETFHLASHPDYGYQGCGWADPSHDFDGGRVHLNNGRMDGWLLTEGTASDPNDHFPVGYYTAEDLPFYAGVAQHFTVCDRYFHGVLTSTFPNRMYIHAGATDFLQNDLPFAQREPSTLPTIWDLLTAAGVSHKNYFHELPTTGLWGTKYVDHMAPFAQFLVDAAAGKLPAVSYIDPFFGAAVGESPAGISQDDHPQADVRDGQVFLNRIYDALRASPNWERTLMIVTYDEWGGFYDHVVPPFAPISDAERAIGNDGRLGFRTPCVIIGPRARRGHVSHLQFDPNSVINLIRWRWRLGPVGDSPRNQTSINMAHALDFDNPPKLEAPSFGLAPRVTPYGALCTATFPGSPDPHNAEINGVLEMIRGFGVPV